MEKIRLGDITNCLDNKRKPLNSQDRKKITTNKLYPYYGACNLMDYVGEYLFDGTYLCVAEDGGKWGEHEKSCYIISEKCWVNNHAHVLEIKEGYLLKYIYYYLNYEDLNPYISGAVVRKLTRSSLDNILIPKYDLPTQQKIVEELDCLSEAIEKKKQQLAELDNLIKSKFNEMFGDVLKNNKNFPLCHFGDYVNQMNIGPFGSDLKNDCFVEKKNSYCMVYEQKHAIEKSIDIERRYIDKVKYNQLKRFEIGPGDIIVSCRGTIGRCYVLPNNAPRGVIHPSLMMLKPKQNINNNFLLFLLEHILEEQNEQGSGVKMAIKATELASIVTIKPSLDIQNQFINLVEQVDKTKTAIQQSIDELQTLFNERMQHYFGE